MKHHRVHLAGIPVLSDPTIPPGVVYAVNSTRFSVPYVINGQEETSDERAAREMADRLLNRTGAITLEMLHRVVDRITSAQSVEHLIMHPQDRRVYLNLLEADKRYTNAP